MVKKLMGFLVAYGLAFIYGLYFVYRLFIRWLKNPSEKFWTTKTRLPPDALNDIRYGTHSYIQVKDVKLHYVEKGDRSKPLMLCVHGFPECWYSWRHQLIEFSSDYWVVALDMRGYGDSEKPVSCMQYEIKYLVEDLQNIIKGLGKEKCTLLAHDWGGIVAWHLVLTQPQLVDKYVIMNSTHPIAFMSVINSSQKQFKSSWYVYFFQCPYLPEFYCLMDDMKFFDHILKSEKSPPSTTETDLEVYKYQFGKPGAFTFPINYYRANLMMGSAITLQGLGKNDDFPPGLVLYGDGDIFLTLQTQEESVKLVKNTKLVCIKGANHFVQQDDPQAVNFELKKFFSEVQTKEK